MNEEMNNVIETEEIVNDLVSEDLTSEGGSSKGFIALVCVVAVAATAGAAYLHRTKEQRKAKKIDKMINALEVEGYTVEKDVDYIDVVETEVEDIKEV